MGIKETIQEYNKDRNRIEALAKADKPYDGNNPLLKLLWSITKTEISLSTKKETKEEAEEVIKDTEIKLKELNKTLNDKHGEMLKNINKKEDQGVKTWSEYKKE